MKISLPKLAALALLVGCTSAQSQTLNWRSVIGTEIVNSSGQEIDSEGVGLENTFLFQLGVFEEDFIPDETNMGQWLANWHVFDSAMLGNNGDGTSQFSSTAVVPPEPVNASDPPNPDREEYLSMFEGLKGYIWIRNQAGTEFFLASASTWTFPTAEECCPTNTFGWSMSEVVVPVWGSNDSGTPGDYYIQTHAVPEAGSTLLGLIACGMTVLRRRRTVLG